MLKIPFKKMHGLGNDFIMLSINDLPEEILTTSKLNEFVKKISDRHIGIGADQFILYEVISPENINMRVYNQDGSKALACGNASRCLSRLIYDKLGAKKITLNVDGRKVFCEYIDINNINVDMGEVSFNSDWMPNNDKLWKLSELYSIEPKEMLCVDVANPHLVIFSKLSAKEKNMLGSSLQNGELFKNGVNINFAEVDGDNIYLRVWERGAGFTYACGSGAIASFAAAIKLGFVEKKARIKFKLGDLVMSKKYDKIIMTGPAEYVFSGEYYV